MDFDAVWEQLQQLCADTKDKTARQQALAALTRMLRAGHTLANDRPLYTTVRSPLQKSAVEGGRCALSKICFAQEYSSHPITTNLKEKRSAAMK